MSGELIAYHLKRHRFTFRGYLVPRAYFALAEITASKYKYPREDSGSAIALLTLTVKVIVSPTS